MPDYSANLHAIQDDVNRACDSVAREPSSVTLIAVSKTQPVEAIKALYDLGVRDFGESRLQEAIPKIESLPNDIRWHFIGTLQSNKAKRAAQSFDLIHTLHNEGQLREVDKAARNVDGFIEVNVANESQKSGLPLEMLDGFAAKVLQSPSVHFRGLMTIGPAVDDPEKMRPYFRALREANTRLGGDWLSMGMSGDYFVAIQEGSTHIRVGTALFGAR